MLKGLIFDFDGTILDTEEPWYNAYSELYNKYGQELTLSQYTKTIGANRSSKDYIDPIKHLIDLTDEQLNYEELEKAVVMVHQKLMVDKSMRAGIMDTLKEAKSKQFKIGLASSSSKKWVVIFLNQLGIIDYFDAIRTADDVVISKPHPDLYLKTLEALNLKNHEVFAIEDSPNGCLSAKTAGIKCVVVPHVITENMDFPQCEMRLQSLDQMTFNQLIEGLSLINELPPSLNNKRNDEKR